jgi:hypothetical protein
MSASRESAANTCTAVQQARTLAPGPCDCVYTLPCSGAYHQAGVVYVYPLTVNGY